jgi:atlastin
VTEDDHTFTLNEEALERILLDKRVRDKKVIVVSVAGAYRKGKSFLLDFFLRCLSNKGSGDWLGDPSQPLKGFPWRGGSDRNTSGILMWSEPFDVVLPSGEQACVLLMDTQGAFDSQSTVKDCATVFALSTMLSSIQIYNIMSNIQEDDLQHLQLFTEYGRLALEATTTKPFQHLHFLVRDWPFPYDYDYGSVGGERLLDQRLQINASQHLELQQLRNHLRSCFVKIGCFLMPHPGLTVATMPQFDGRLADIEDDFKVNVKEFVGSLLSANNLVLKEINGSPITGRELIEYFKAYMKIYQGNELPEPKSMLQATAEANNLSAVANAKDLYTKEMEKICGGDKPFLHPDLLNTENLRCRKDALDQFNSTRKMGGDEFSKVYAVQLEEELEAAYDNLLKHNIAKNVYTGVQTPVIIFTTVLALYIIATLFGMLGLESFANIVNLLMLVLLGVLAAWVYTRATGNYPEVGKTIDLAATTLHELVRPASAASPFQQAASDAKKTQ